MTTTDQMMVWLRETMGAAWSDAEDATPGAWHVTEYTAGSDYGFDAGVGTAPGEVDVVGHGYEGGGCERVQDARHIVRHQPAAVLRRIAADRKMLDLHAIVPDHGRFSERDNCERSGCDGDHWQPPVCRSCRNYAGDPIEAPCPTIENLAEGYGWKGDQ
ncbi:DUF6221 family protein [Streptomyces sp. NPDC093272]|uniref:DUF6221 family protein n=1 Tax=Streptomyces sp. NPDC093272 TaxID=3154981 RepID=UPI0034341216